MSTKDTARAVADLAEGHILASVEIAAPPERVFQALVSTEVLDWWVRPGVFDTREWAGDVRAGGHWNASGIGNGRPYTLEGEFLEIDPPRKLVHTWYAVGAPGAPTTVSYLLEQLDGGTRITLHHSGFTSREVCLNTCLGWETSFERLATSLADNRWIMTRKEAAVSFLHLASSGAVKEAYRQYVAANFRHHNPYFLGTAVALSAAMQENADQFPQKAIDIKRALADGDLVAVHAHVRLQPSDLGVATIHLFRFEGDHIVELWDVGQAVPEKSVNDNGMF